MARDVETNASPLRASTPGTYRHLSSRPFPKSRIKPVTSAVSVSVLALDSPFFPPLLPGDNDEFLVSPVFIMEQKIHKERTRIRRRFRSFVLAAVVDFIPTSDRAVKVSFIAGKPVRNI